MNNAERTRIVMHSMHLLSMWVDLIDRNDQWKTLHMQAFRDALESMKQCGLIKDYDTKGVVYPNHQRITLVAYRRKEKDETVHQP